jgi:hypothetical protein
MEWACGNLTTPLFNEVTVEASLGELLLSVAPVAEHQGC